VLVALAMIVEGRWGCSIPEASGLVCTVIRSTIRRLSLWITMHTLITIYLRFYPLSFGSVDGMWLLSERSQDSGQLDFTPIQ